MADRELRLRVGASIDASFSTVLASVVEQVKRARKQIRNDVSASLRVQVAAEKAAAMETATAEKQKVKTAKNLADEQTKDVNKAARERVRIEKQALKEMERDLRDHNRMRAQQERENLRIFRQAAREAEREKAGQAKDISRKGAMMMRAGGAALSAGMRFAGSMAHGMGVETGVQQQLMSSVERERLAVSISNQAWIPSGGGPRGSDKRVDSNEIMAAAHKTAIGTGMETNDLLQGLEKYVAHTGDLQTILANMEDLAKISKANGASFMDMALAASELANEMGDIPNKGKAVFDTMRALAGQGQVTAIEIRDQAKSAAMIAAQSNFYEIDPMHKRTLEAKGVTDDVGQRVAVLGGLAQMARSKGGRVTARMAMQSSMAFMRDLANPTEIKRFKEQGLEVYADKGHTKLRDPVQMLMESFRVARSEGGVNRDVLNRIFTNQQSRAVTNAFAQNYNEEYALAVKRGVVSEEERHKIAMERTVESFEKLLATTQSMDQIEQSFGLAMKTTEAQAKVLNNQIGQVTDEMSKALLPVLKALAPAVISAASALGKFASKILGFNQEKDDTKRVELSLGATNAVSGLKAGLREGTLSEDDIAEAKKKKEEIEKELEKRRANMKDRDWQTAITIQGKGWFDPNRSETADKASDAFIAEAAAQEGGAGGTARRVQEDRRAMASLEDSLQQIIAGLTVAKNREAEGTLTVVSGKPLEVHIVADSSQKPSAQPVTSGTANPNSSHE